MNYIKLNWHKLIILIVSFTAMSGSLYFSEIVGYLPCNLCWWQRIFMYPIVFIIIMGLFQKGNEVLKYIGSLSFIGMFVSSYHIFIEETGNESAFCAPGTVSCAVKYIDWYGFITIPVLCFTAFLLINLTLIVYIILQCKSKNAN